MFNNSNNSVSKYNSMAGEHRLCLAPNPRYLAALRQLDQIVSGLEVQFDRYGEIRHLAMSSSDKLVGKNPAKKDYCHLLAQKDPIALANAFLSNSIIDALLGKQSPLLSLNCVSSFPFGHRVDFRQVARLAGIDHALSVRGGALNIAIDNGGHIFNMTSTIRHGAISTWPVKIIPESEAVNQAKMSFAQAVIATQCQLMLSAHAGKFDLIYEVTLHSERSENSIVYLLLAETGAIVHRQTAVLQSDCRVPKYGDNYLSPDGIGMSACFSNRFVLGESETCRTGAHNLFKDRDMQCESKSCCRGFGASTEALSQNPVLPELSNYAPADTCNASLQAEWKSPLTNTKTVHLQPLSVPASALLQTPNANKPIARQVSDTIIKDLPDMNILGNKYFVLLLGSQGKPVYAKPDGTFCYKPSDAEFAAVTTFISLNSQLALYLALGLKAPDRPLLVFVNDTAVIDNAYFNPHRYELHIGIGSGLKRNGLNKHMSFDLGVANHEFGHTVVYLQTPSHDLSGLEGSAIHEAIGDVLGTLVMQYLVKLWYAKQFGSGITAADIKADQRIIGSYAAWPTGIRSQKNNKRMPDDFVAEPHLDGLIIGGALADLLVDLATKPNANLEDQIRLFVEIALMALALVPSHKVAFTDLLRAFLTADRQITKGVYRQNIERCFARHGITLAHSVITHSQPKTLAA